MTCLVNGEAQSVISADDRGLAYGDGLFETIAVIDGAPVLPEAHLERLQRGCDRLALPFDHSLAGLLLEESARLIAELDAERCVVKWIVTRGVGGRGYSPPGAVRLNRIVRAHPWPEYPADHWHRGVEVMVTDQRLSPNPGLAGLKHLNRLEQVLASIECDRLGYNEGLMLNLDGEAIECIRGNLFVVRNGRVTTPPLDECGVAGVMREFLLAKAAHLGVAAAVERAPLSSLEEASEMFLCNSVIGIWPVRRLVAAAQGLERSLEPGAITTGLQRLVAEELGLVPG